MKRMIVTSASIQSIGFDSEQNILEIEWPRKKIYQYTGCPPGNLTLQQHYMLMLEAGAKDDEGNLITECRDADQYFNRHLRNALGVSYQRLPDEVVREQENAGKAQ